MTSLVTLRQAERLLVEATLEYIKNPTDAGKDEVRHYAEMVFRHRGEK